jgi:hypothetical protein
VSARSARRTTPNFSPMLAKAIAVRTQLGRRHGSPADSSLPIPATYQRQPVRLLRPATESLLAPGEVTLACIRWPIGCPGPAPNRQDHQKKGNDNQYSTQQHWIYPRMAGSGARAAQQDDRTALAPPNSNAPPLVESAVQGWWRVPMTRYDPR